MNTCILDCQNKILHFKNFEYPNLKSWTRPCTSQRPRPPPWHPGGRGPPLPRWQAGAASEQRAAGEERIEARGPLLEHVGLPCLRRARAMATAARARPGAAAARPRCGGHDGLGDRRPPRALRWCSSTPSLAGAPPTLPSPAPILPLPRSITGRRRASRWHSGAGAPPPTRCSLGRRPWCGGSPPAGSARVQACG